MIILTKQIGDWPSIVNRGCKFALQSRWKFLDQVRILIKGKILWNHDRILLSPGAGEELYATFQVKTDPLENSVWIELINPSRGLRWPKSIQTGMLEFNPMTVETFTMAKFCSMMGKSQRFAFLEWWLVNPENISEFLQKMKVDQRFKTY